MQSQRSDAEGTTDPDAEGDDASVTGASGAERDDHVGRVAGSDVGYAEEQGGERRKKWDEEHAEPAEQP